MIILQSQPFCQQSNEFRIGGLSTLTADGAAEVFGECLRRSPVPGGLYGAADTSFYSKGSGTVTPGDLRIEDLGYSLVQYVYMLRCTPVKGDYQFYIYCYQRKPFEKAQKEQQKNDRLAVKKRAEPER